MKLLFAIAIIALIALIGSRITFLNRQLPLGIRNILFTGVEYILMGVFLGKMGLNLLDFETLQNLEPFLLFGLCWVGFLFGLQFEIRLLKKLPRYYFSITAIQAFITFLLVTVSFYYILKSYLPLQQGLIYVIAITLGSTASCTAQSAVGIFSRNFRVENRGLLDLLRYISGVDGLFALAFFAVALSILAGNQSGSYSSLSYLKWFLTAVATGFIPALILMILSRTKFSQPEYLLFVIGIIMFGGGLAFQLGHSPLISGLVCGILTANLSRHRLRALAIVIHSERSIYIMLLLLIGAAWRVKFDHSLILVGVYFLTRTCGKVVGTFGATKVFKPIYHVPQSFGLALISEGGLAIAIAINFKFMAPEVSNMVVTIIVGSVIINEFLSPRLILTQFDKAELIASNNQTVTNKPGKQ